MNIDSSVKTVVKLIGTSKDVKKAMAELIIEDDIFTFDSFIPMPDDLIGTSTTQELIPDEDYERILMDFKVRMDRGEVAHFEVPPMSHTIQKNYIKKYGYDNWEDWSLNNWGCKGGTFDTEVISDTEFSFCTINATPHPAMVRMSMKYPKVEFRIKYADEDVGYNVGHYTILNGSTIHTDVFKTFSTESFLTAYNIIQDDYYTRELFHELNEEEALNAISGKDEYLHIILYAILELEIIDSEYGTIINDYLLNKAVDYEQYEYAARLKNLFDSQVPNN